MQNLAGPLLFECYRARSGVVVTGCQLENKEIAAIQTQNQSQSDTLTLIQALTQVRAFFMSITDRPAKLQVFF